MWQWQQVVHFYNILYGSHSEDCLKSQFVIECFRQRKMIHTLQYNLPLVGIDILFLVRDWLWKVGR